MKYEFENLWNKDIPEKREIITIWKQFHESLESEKAEERLNQIVFIAKNEFNQVVGISTAFKTHIKQLRNTLYAVRILVLPDVRGQGLAVDLLGKTRDFLQEIHQEDGEPKCIGLITLVENEDLKKRKNEAIWPKSKMVYIGNSGKGHHIRVYYF
ncbi:MAG: hypothetical protein HC811_06285, partial [Flammeovirgaceae bacterium]|nr:hypothetical protein [Flammeovirgaceae bacterium]